MFELFVKIICYLSSVLHLRSLSYKILYRCIPHRCVNIAGKYEKDINILNRGKIDGKSCICINKVCEPKYDLQIIMPVYNGEKYVKECIESILSQKTKYSFLLIIVDDGSTDRTKYIVDEYITLPNVRIIHQKNRGHAGARNVALQQIEATYVMLIDSDDLLEEGAIEVLLNRAKLTNANIVQGNYHVFWENDTNNIRDSINDRVYGQPWGKIYSADLFSKVCFPENYWFDDTLTNMILVPLAKRIELVEDFVYCWRRNSQSFTSNYKNNDKVLDAYFVTTQLLSDQRGLGIEKSTFMSNHIAKQMAVNARRISSLRNGHFNKAHFRLAVDIMKDHAEHFHATGYWNKKIEESLLNNDYYGFVLCRIYSGM